MMRFVLVLALFSSLAFSDELIIHKMADYEFEFYGCKSGDCALKEAGNLEESFGHLLYIEAKKSSSKSTRVAQNRKQLRFSRYHTVKV